MIRCSSVSNAASSRKNRVTPISRSSYSELSSRGSRRSCSTYISMSIDLLSARRRSMRRRHGGHLVMGEVDRVLVAQQPQDGVDAPIVRRQVLRIGRLAAGAAADRRDGVGDLVGRQDLLDDPGAHRAQRHAVELCGLRAFTEHHAAGAVDLLDAARAVAAAARQHHGNRLARRRPAPAIERTGRSAASGRGGGPCR